MPFRFIATVAAITLAGVLAACGSGDKPASSVASTEAAGDNGPLALAPR